ncbi:MAG: NAD(P)H-binding protein [Rhodoferax sp.]|nr:NAD(P)H-binding protein [Rhodoferax sp.]
MLSRGHRVTVLARNPSKIGSATWLTVVAADALTPPRWPVPAGHDAVISAYNPGWSEPKIHDVFLQACQAILDGAKQSGVKRRCWWWAAAACMCAGPATADTPPFPLNTEQGGALAARELPKPHQTGEHAGAEFSLASLALALR